MIKRISLKNFRSHADTELEFSPGINVIVGLPDKGKTNILRAMQWVIFNRPLGQRIRSNFSKKPTRVSVELDDKVVSLVAGKKGKRYEIEQGGTVKKYRAMGSDVPDLVTSAFNLTEVNIQKQLDKPFLITESGSAVSKVLNRITRLEKVDVWMKKLNHRLLSKGKEMSLLQGQVREKKERLEGLRGISKLKRELDEVQKIGEGLATLDSDIADLTNYIIEIETSAEVLGKYKGTAALLRECDELLVDKKGIETIEDKLESLDDIIPQIRTVVAEVNRLDEQIVAMMGRYKKLLLSKKSCPFCPVCTTDIKKHNVEKLLEGV